MCVQVQAPEPGQHQLHGENGAGTKESEFQLQTLSVFLDQLSCSLGNILQCLKQQLKGKGFPLTLCVAIDDTGSCLLEKNKPGEAEIGEKRSI